ncbi:MAG: glycosyltransferase [Thermodesulfovibrionia bacterium]|nr:glycosyltransferase [Thermodesulfovibrionia bacterium]
MPKKVLMVTGPVHTVPPLKGAAVETWMYEVSRRLSGYEPHIISISHPLYPLEEFRDGIYFHRIRFGKAYRRIFQKMTRLDPLSYQKRIARIINQVRPDIVHMHNFTKWSDSLVSLIKNSDTKTLLHQHNEFFGAIPDTPVDHLLCCSRFITELPSSLSIKAKGRSHIYNGVNLERFRPHWECVRLKEEMRSRFGIKKDEFVAMYVGRVSPEKGVEHFIRSALLLKEEKNIRFLVVGEIAKGQPGNKRVIYGKDMIKLAKPLGDKIIFTDVFPPSEIHLLYLSGNVMVVPSNFEEPFGMVGIEAMATGLPVIARKKGGITEYVADGTNGYLIDEERMCEDIAGKIRMLSADNDLRMKIGREGRKTVENGFSWEDIAKEVEKLYNKLTE